MKIEKIIMFGIIFIAILGSYLAAHAAVYFSLVKFFAISTSQTKNILILALIFFSVSFFVAAMLSHSFDSVFTRGYYLISGFWVGLMINFLIFSAIVWVIVIFGQWFGFMPKEKMLAILAIVATLLYSFYGSWNAFNPKVTRFNVAIDSLPKVWVGKKIVQISDVHLGHVYRKDYLAGVVKKINAINPEIVVITGDLFDGTDGNLDSFLAPLDEIKAPVYFITGNHETYLGLEEAYGAIAKTKIIPLRDSLANLNGLQLIGIDYPLRGDDRNITKIIPKMDGYDQFAPSILLIHEPLQIENAKKLGIGLQLSGHTHRGQLFPFGIISSLVFHGYDHGFKREGHYAIYTSSGLGGWGPPMRTENRSEIVEITLL